MNNTLTLWRLLDQQEIVIPMIQRDYAQGRSGKEHIRSAFLKDVEMHLNDGTNLTLDFVYGNTEGGKFHPLDGQQRLTTLWLAYWYVAFRLGKLKEATDILKRFSYQTRASSSDFCKMLCEKMAEVNQYDVGNVAEYIKGQTWFFAEWLQDPTVNAMLRTLSGDRSGSAEDHIQGVFQEQYLSRYWENLTQNNVITFELMNIGTEELPISDDLYIKMNARGKKLTDFENFKADWIAYIQRESDISEKIGDEELCQYYPKRIDNEWTDVFWSSREKTEAFDGNIDQIFFSFINRFVLNLHCLREETAIHYNSRKHIATDEATKAIQKKFDALYGTGLGKKKKTNDDSLIEYKGFDIYQEGLTSTNLKKLDRIFGQLKDNPNRIPSLNFSGIDEDEEAEETENQDHIYYFLPQYNEKDGVAATRLKERIYFHAICLFLEEPNWEQLESWKRVVWNLVENAAIENIENMIGCLREIDGLGKLLREKNWEVCENLSGHTLTSSVSQLVNQWEEEKQKAAKITESKEMQHTIENAEKYAFFKGSIRFLYTGPDGKVDWSNFETKFHNAQSLFRKNEKVSPKTIKMFLGMFESFEDLKNIDSYFFTNVGYHTRHNCWKKDILCRTDLYEQVDAFLMKRPIVAKGDYLAFLESGAIEAISEKSYNYNYRCRDSKDWGIHRDHSPTEGIFISSERLRKNRMMLELQEEGKITMMLEKELKNDFLWGKEIAFYYSGKQYCWALWDGKNWIYPAEDANAAKEWTKDIDKNGLEKLMQSLHCG